jgi:hypothetical protein
MLSRSQLSSPNRILTLWTARGALGLVLTWNLQAALAFIVAPDAHAPGFEVEGVPGQVVVRGFGILFLMWNVPYMAALVHPMRQIVPFACAVVAQLIGLAGETWMFFTLSPGHETLRATGLRFIAFDGAGFFLLAVTFALVLHLRQSVSRPQVDAPPS